MPEPVLTGRCLCGGVRYEVRGQPAFMSHCHCSLCRRSTGTASSTGLPVPREWFRFVAGEDRVRVYRHEDRKDMPFCSVCGSVLVSSDRWPEAPTVRLRAGTLDGDPGIRPQAHIFVGSKAAWDEIADDVPQYDAYPQGEDGRRSAAATRHAKPGGAGRGGPPSEVTILLPDGATPFGRDTACREVEGQLDIRSNRQFNPYISQILERHHDLCSSHR